MACCSSSVEGINKFFSKNAKRYLKRFRRRGLAKEQRYLVEGIAKSPLTDKTVLEIGCGVGGLHLTLLKQGARSATGIELSEGMLEGAKRLSRELGFEDRTSYVLGDFAQENGSIPAADITILDKVVCCYKDIDTLMTRTFEKTRSTLALSFPKPHTIIKLFFHVPIMIGKLLHWSFHPYWHDWNRLLDTIRQSGFEQVYHKATFVWAVYVLRRT